MVGELQAICLGGTIHGSTLACSLTGPLPSSDAVYRLSPMSVYFLLPNLVGSAAGS
jgi:hypothetical protein